MLFFNMTEIKEICSRNWDFTLYNVDGEIVLTVVFFGQIDVNRSFKIANDISKIEESELNELAEHIRTNYEDYKNVEITPAIFE